MLGLEIRMIEILGLFEHVLAEDPVVQSCRGDRAHVVEAAGLDCLGEFDRVARAVDVAARLGFGARFEVVHSGQVKEVIDLALEQLGVCV